MKDHFAQMIVERIERETQRLRKEFHPAEPIQTRRLIIDDLLPAKLAQEIHAAFPPHEAMRLMKSFREVKYTTKALDRCLPIIRDVEFAFQSPQVVQAVSRVTGMHELTPDPALYAGGLSAMAQGHYLQPHIDNSHNGERTHYRRLNLLYYVTPDWRPEYGGNLELWDDGVRRRVEIPSLFNRFVIMETNRRSWHSVNQVRHNGVRCCVSNYYFSAASPEAFDYFHVTSFMARPEQPAQRLFCRVDNAVRHGVRMVRKQGLGQTDVYRAEKH